jgi:hypothetical protein
VPRQREEEGVDSALGKRRKMRAGWEKSCFVLIRRIREGYLQNGERGEREREGERETERERQRGRETERKGERERERESEREGESEREKDSGRERERGREREIERDEEGRDRERESEQLLSSIERKREIRAVFHYISTLSYHPSDIKFPYFISRFLSHNVPLIPAHYISATCHDSFSSHSHVARIENNLSFIPATSRDPLRALAPAHMPSPPSPPPLTPAHMSSMPSKMGSQCCSTFLAP